MEWLGNHTIVLAAAVMALAAFAWRFRGALTRKRKMPRLILGAAVVVIAFKLFNSFVRPPPIPEDVLERMKAMVVQNGNQSQQDVFSMPGGISAPTDATRGSEQITATSARYQATLPVGQKDIGDFPAGDSVYYGVVYYNVKGGDGSVRHEHQNFLTFRNGAGEWIIRKRNE